MEALKDESAIELEEGVRGASERRWLVIRIQPDKTC